jgi:putative transposase
MRLSREIEGAIKNATVSRRGNHWFVSIQTEIEVEQPVHASGTATGIDRGVVNLATLADGTAYSGAKSLSRRLRRLAREQRRLSRKVRFSNNWKKQRDRIARLHIQITDARMDALHKATTAISKSHALVCLEKLRVNNMSSSARGSVDCPGSRVRQKAGLNRAILDSGWGLFARMLEYKQAWRGGLVEYVNPAYTSQTCSACGHVDALRRGTSRKPEEGKGVSLPVKQEPEVAVMSPLPVAA